MMLIALGHPQPPTPIKTDNSTAHGFVYDNINLKKSKSWDMRYYWLRDKEHQKDINFFREPGTQNNADYFTNHHATNHHREHNFSFWEIITPLQQTTYSIQFTNIFNTKGYVASTYPSANSS